MGFVRRYSEINRSAGEEEQRRRPTRKILVHEEGVQGLSVLLGDEDGNEEEERARRTGPTIYVSISWRARVRRESHPGWTADGGLVRRGHLPAESNPLRPSVLYWRRPRSGAPEDAPGDPTPFQASALLQHSRVMLLDLGDLRGWLYSGHTGQDRSLGRSHEGIAIYRALMINRQKSCRISGFNDRKLEEYEHLRI